MGRFSVTLSIKFDTCPIDIVARGATSWLSSPAICFFCFRILANLGSCSGLSARYLRAFSSSLRMVGTELISSCVRAYSLIFS